MFSEYTRGAKPLLRALRTAPKWPGHRRCISLQEKEHDPLRILFCGADEFSIHSLRALHDLKDEKPNTIASIDVVCRPDKRTGRGLKYIHQVPVKPVAESLGLPIHQIDTFKGWDPPSPIDLVVAVSFGLLVPARILSAARYGGLNVHPSLLPDLRGPSPLQYALMLGRKQTGVSIQTMHPTKFDHGAILAQETISIPDDWTLEQLSETSGRLGASLLRTAVEKAMFISPVNSNSTEQRVQSELVHAPKITKEDAHVDWRNWTSDKVIRYGRVLELWDETTYPICFPGKSARVKYQGPWVFVDQADAHLCTFDGDSAAPPGHPFALSMDHSKKWRLVFRTSDGCLVSPSSASIEGKKEGGGVQALTQVLRKYANAQRISAAPTP